MNELVQPWHTISYIVSYGLVLPKFLFLNKKGSKKKFLMNASAMSRQTIGVYFIWYLEYQKKKRIRS